MVKQKLHLFLCRGEHGLYNHMVLGKQVTASIRLLATRFGGFNDKMPYDTRAGFTKKTFQTETTLICFELNTHRSIFTLRA